MELEQKLKQLLEEEDVVLGEEMKYHTTFRVGGPAHFFVTPKTEEQLQSVLKLCKETDTPWFIL